MRSGASIVVLFSAGRFVHSLHHGRLVEQDNPRLAVLRVPRVVEVAEVDVGDALVRLVHNSHTDVTILLVLAVQRVPHNIVRGLRVKTGNAEDLITSPVRGSSTSATRAAWGSKGPPWRASAPVPHDHLLAPLLQGLRSHSADGSHKKSPGHKTSTEAKLFLHFTVLL